MCGRSDGAVAQPSSIVLLTLMSAQFLMTLDSSVMNVSIAIATVADDLGTTITRISTVATEPAPR